MVASPHVVNATAQQRLGAKLIDAAPVLLLTLVVLGQGWLLSAQTPREAAADVLPVALTALAAYGLWLWIWEARTGKTPGNLAVGIRTTDEAGHPPGLLGIFLRGMLLILSAATVAGPLVVLISNIWDSHGQRQGWHDKAARTLSVDVKAGRNPLITGGLLPSRHAAGAGWVPPHHPG